MPASARNPLIRLAASLSLGSDERRVILAMVKKQAGLMDDMLARADYVSGLLNKKPNADRSAVLGAITNGIGPFFVEFDKWIDEATDRNEVNDLDGLREKEELAEGDQEALTKFDQRRKSYGPVADKLVDIVNRDQLLSNRNDFRLREAIMAGAAKGIHGMVQTLPSGQRSVTDVGRGGVSTPGSMGVDAEDLAQVMMAGGIKMPGMIFDARKSAETPYEGLKIRGVFKDRKKAWAPAGASIFTLVGTKVKDGSMGAIAGYARKVAMNAAIDWKRSVHVSAEYILSALEEGELSDESAINRGAKPTLDGLLGFTEIGGEKTPRKIALARYYINKINQQMLRHMDGMQNRGKGTPKAIWLAVAAMVLSRKNPFKERGGTLDLDVPKVLAYLEKHPDFLKSSGLDQLPKKGIVQARWKQVVLPRVRESLIGLSDRDLLRNADPEYLQILQDKDMIQTYLSDLKRTASRTITASERTAMIRLAALLPVGSPERRALIAGCEAMKSPAMVESCEAMKAGNPPGGKGKSKAKSDDKKDDKKKDDKKKDDGKMPAALLEKFEAKDKKAAGAVSKAQALGRSADKRKVGVPYNDKELQKLLTPLAEADDLDEYSKTLEAYVNARQRQMHQDAEKDLRAMGIDAPHWKKAGEVPDALKKHQFTDKDGDNPPPADADGDGKTNEPKPFKGKKADDHEEAKEKYPWDECIEQQTKAYSAEAAPKICGKIRSESQGRAANTRSALLRMAATMPKGAQGRMELLVLAQGL